MTEVLRGWSGLRVLALAPTPTAPLDQGNRRRIFYVLDRLQRSGATITYVHYPAEQEWRDTLPDHAQLQMQHQWNRHFTIPATRPLHARPNSGLDHGIDEWWDPAIGHLLQWLFTIERYDLFIVNYAWLSKALTLCPKHTLRILDTHDQFSSRRGMLEANGIPPEFFHISQDDERIALDRADVVWAIKSQEADCFRALTDRPVITLGHAEPGAELGDRKADKMADGVLRVGIVGARNNVNRQNITAFLQVAERSVHHSLLPLEIIVAGSCCEDLGDLKLPSWIHLIGRVPDMGDIYQRLDAVLLPMRFSSGLKIRTGEALGLGLPVIAHAHAFEGYPATHPFHMLTSFEAMMEACWQLASDPPSLSTLAEASRRSHKQTLSIVTQALTDTLEIGRQLPCGAIVVLAAAALSMPSLAFEHALEVVHYVAPILPVAIWVHGPLSDVHLPALETLRRTARVVLDQAACDSLPYKTSLMPVRTWHSLMAEHHAAFWLTSAVPSPPPAGWPGRIYVHADLMEHQFCSEKALDMIMSLAGNADVIVHARKESVLASALLARGYAVERVPLYWRGNTSALLQRLEMPWRQEILIIENQIDSSAARITQAALLPNSAIHATHLKPAEVLDRLWQGPPPLGVVLGADIEASALEEILLRSGVPTMRLNHHGLFAIHQKIRHLAADPGRKVTITDPFCQNDAGWCRVWAYLAAVVKSQAALSH